MEVLHAHHRLPRGTPPADDIFAHGGCPLPASSRSPCPGPGPAEEAGRRHALAGLLAAGIAAVIAGSKSFAAIGQWAGDAGPDVLAVLGAERGPAEESTYRRAFALVSADVLDQVLGAWLCTRAVRAGGRLVIAIDGKTVRGAKSKGGKAPHLVAALAHGIGAVLGQVAVDEKTNEIPAVRELLKAFADLAGAVITIDAMHTQTDTAQGDPRPAGGLRDDRRACFTLLLLLVMACQTVQPGRVRPGYAGLCGVRG